MGGRWAISAFRLPGLDFFNVSPPSMFRWPVFNLSSIITPPRWSSESIYRWLDFDLSIVDNVMWSFVTVFESVALVSMLCFFFLFCGCTI